MHICSDKWLDISISCDPWWPVSRKGDMHLTNTWLLLHLWDAIGHLTNINIWKCRLTSCDESRFRLQGLELNGQRVLWRDLLFWLVRQQSLNTCIGWIGKVKYLYCIVGEFCPKHAKYYFWTWMGAVHIELKTKQNTMVNLVEMSNLNHGGRKL